MTRSLVHVYLIFLFVVSCDNEKVIIEIDQKEYTNIDIESMLNIKLSSIADKDKLNDAIGNKLMRGLKVASYFDKIKVNNFPESSIEKNTRYKLAFEILTKKIFPNRIQSDAHLIKYYKRSSTILDIKHLHIQIDSLNEKGYNFTAEEFNNLKRTISEQLHNDANNIDSYIIKYGYRPDLNRALGISWGYFPYGLEDKIFTIFENGGKSTDGFIESPYGFHYAVIIRSRENDKFEYKTFEKFSAGSEEKKYANMRNEFVRYRKFYFDKLLADAEVQFNNQNIVKALISMNGLEESDFDDFKYANLPLASFYLNNKSQKIDVMTNDIHYFNFDKMFKKIAGLQQKPKLMLVYIENYISAILAYEDMKKNGFEEQLNEKIIQYETNMLKFDTFKSNIKKVITVSETEIENYFNKNKTNFMVPPKRKTFGISVSISDSAKLFADYKNMNPKNMLDYYVKYNPYIKSKKNIKMRLLGDFQKNSFGLISEEAFKLKRPNLLSEIIKYKNLFYIFYYTKETKSRLQDITEVKSQIFKSLATEKYQAKTDSIDQLINTKYAGKAHYFSENL